MAGGAFDDAELEELYSDDGVGALSAVVPQLETGGIADPDHAISRAGAVGRNQIIPTTAQQYGFDPGRLTDPAYNDQVRNTILVDLSRRFGGDQAAVLAGYNGGPGRARRFVAAGHDPSVLPRETQGYVSKGLRLLGALADSVVPGAQAAETEGGALTDSDVAAMYGAASDSAPPAADGGLSDADLAGMYKAAAPAPAPAPQPAPASPTISGPLVVTPAMQADAVKMRADIAALNPQQPKGIVQQIRELFHGASTEAQKLAPQDGYDATAAATARHTVQELVGGTHARPNPAAPEDTGLQTAAKFVQNLPAILKGQAGGALRAMGETVAEPNATAAAGMTSQDVDAVTAGPRAAAAQAADQPGTMAHMGKRLYAEAQAHLKANAPNIPDNSIKSLAYDIANGFVQMAPAVVATAVTKSPVPALVGFAGQAYSETYGKSRAAGRSPEEAQADALFSGAANSIPAALPLHAIMRPGQKFMGKVLASAGAMAAQNVMTTALQRGYDAGVLKENMTWEQAVHEMERSGLVGFVTGGIMGAGHHVVERGAKRLQGDSGPLAVDDAAVDRYIVKRDQQYRSERTGPEPPDDGGAAATVGGEGIRGDFQPVSQVKTEGGRRVTSRGALAGTETLVPEKEGVSPAAKVPPPGAADLDTVHDPETWVQTGWKDKAGNFVPLGEEPVESGQSGAKTADLTPDQAKAALASNIDPATGKRPKGNAALRDFRARMQAAIDGQDVSVNDVAHEMQQMPNGSGSGQEILSKMSRRPYEGVAENAPIGRGGADQAEGQGIRQGVPEARETETAALRGVRQSGQPDAPRGLQQAAESDVALPAASSGAARDGKAAGAGEIQPVVRGEGQGNPGVKLRGVKRAIPKDSDHAAAILARAGGLRNDEGHDLVAGRGLQQMIPGVGPLIRKTGKLSIDAAGEVLWNEGFFGPTDHTPRPTEDQVLQLLEKTRRGADNKPVKVYAPERQVEIDHGRAAIATDDQNASVLEDVHKAAKGLGVDLSEDDAHQIMADIGEYGIDHESSVVEHLERKARQDYGPDQADTETKTGNVYRGADDIDFARRGNGGGPGFDFGREGPAPRDGERAAENPRQEDRQLGFKQEVERIRGEAEQRNKTVRETFDADGRVIAESKTRPGYKIVLTKSTTGDAPYRVTSLDEQSGPIGHRDYNSVEEAASEFRSSGFEIKPPKNKSGPKVDLGDAEDGQGNIVPQNVIPGAERLSDAETQRRALAKRMEGRKRATTGQKTTHGFGLFDPKAALEKPAETGDLFGEPAPGKKLKYDPADLASAVEEYRSLRDTDKRLTQRAHEAEEESRRLMRTGPNDVHAAAVTKASALRKESNDHFDKIEAMARKWGDKGVDLDAEIEKPRSEKVQGGFDFAPEPRAARAEKPSSIEDFGEKIIGARKHYAEAYAAKMKDAADVDVAAEPLSKSWPEPEYDKLIEGGHDPWIVSFVRAAREEIPTKPQKSWKLKGWVDTVKLLRKVSNDLMSGDISKERLLETMKKPEYARLQREMVGRADLYMAVGHSKSLKGVSLHAGSYSVFGGVRYNPAKTIWTVERPTKGTAFGNMPRMLVHADTREEAIAAFKRKVGEMPEEGSTTKETRFSLFGRSTSAGRDYFIGKKVGSKVIELKSFTDVKEARAYLTDHHDDLVKILERKKFVPNERKESNAPRVGVDHRNGADVTPEKFADAFGFRGVQFGNYVEGGRRQADLNEAYDALMDMAGIIDVPPRALSLNGELGLAFGARGHGGVNPAKAHYEPGHIVINLTKESGAGSLAHEWWHALDNYFSRNRGEKSGFVTESAVERGTGVRPEVVAAFKRVADTIRSTAIRERSQVLDNRRSSPYWTTGREMSARSFESYVIEKLRDQSASNDYLANIVSEDYWRAAESLGLEGDGGKTASYPYPTAAEVPAIRDAFDNFFRVVETKTENGKEVMFALRDGGAPETPVGWDKVEAGSDGADVDRSKGGRPNRVQMHYSPEMVEQREKWGDALRRRLDQMGLTEYALKVPDWIKAIGENQTDEFGHFVDGMHSALNETIHVALDNQNGIWHTLNHEAIHALKNLDLFTPEEWKILERRSKDWIKKFKIDDLYHYNSSAKNVEEAVAHAFPRWIEGKLENPGNAIKRIFRKMQRFYEAVSNALHGLGFKTAEDVFKDIDSGKVGRRDTPSRMFVPEDPRWEGDLARRQDEGKPLTEKQFYSQYMQHIDARGRDSGKALEMRDQIMRDGFHTGRPGPFTTNAGRPLRPGEQPNPFAKQYQPRNGDVVYLAPKGGWKDTGNGPAIVHGWKPKPYEAIHIQDDEPRSMYERYVEAFDRHKAESETPDFARRQKPAAPPPEPKKKDLGQRAADAIGKFDEVTGKATEAVYKKIADTAARITPDSVKEAMSAIRMGLNPMAAGSVEAKAAGKDFANALREARHIMGRQIDKLASGFKPDQLQRMWEAADEESVLRQQKKTPGENEGLAKLTTEERAVVTAMQRESNAVLKEAKDIGMFKGEGLPSYVPRMVIAMGADGKAERLGYGGETAHGLDAIGRNLKTTSSNLRQRKYLTTAETEEAASHIDPDAMVVKDIRTLPLATGRLREAIAGRRLINAIKEVGRDQGETTVAEGEEPQDGHKWFTIDHPAFKVYRPKVARDANGEVAMENGKVKMLRDEEGNPIFEKVPLYVRDDFEGPLRAVLSQQSSKVMQGFMHLKGKVMSVIMYSPMMHNAVIWGKAFPAAPFKLLNPAWRDSEGKWHFSIELYGRGRQAKNDPVTMKEAIRNGLDPIGHRFAIQDATGIAEQPNLKPGRSWTSQLLAYVPGLFDPKAGDMVKRTVDKLGDIWHNKLLWDLVGDLQMGLYTQLRDHAIEAGSDEQTAGRYAAHFANRYGGILPIEAMSRSARNLANTMLFSRTFTLTNAAAFKDIVKGLPGEVQAQIMRDKGVKALEKIQGTARRKAAAMLLLDALMAHTSVVLAAHAIAYMAGTAYQPPEDNEPDKKDRFLIRYDDDGTAVYGRLPVGKVSEDQQAWITSPSALLKKKLSPFGHFVYGLVSNDKGFGQHIYDPNDDTTKGWFKNAMHVGEFAADSMLPLGPFEAINQMRDPASRGDATTKMLQIMLPVMGITVSKGAPGGPAMAELYRKQDENEFKYQERRRELQAMVKQGKADEVVDELVTKYGFSKNYARYWVKGVLNPQARMSRGKLQKYDTTATPEEKARMERLLKEQADRSKKHSSLSPSDIAPGKLEKFASAGGTWTQDQAIRAAHRADMPGVAALLRQARGEPIRAHQNAGGRAFG